MLSYKALQISVQVDTMNLITLILLSIIISYISYILGYKDAMSFFYEKAESIKIFEINGKLYRIECVEDSTNEPT